MGIKNSSDDTSIRDTYFQSLRRSCTPSGDKISPAIRKQIMTQLTSYITHPEDTSRTAASGCLGALCKWLPQEELDTLMNDNILKDRDDDDWIIRHGRSTVLFVSLKEAPERICNYKLETIILKHLSTDRVPIAINGARSAGYLFMHCLQTNQKFPVNIIGPFCKSMNHSSNEVKQMIAILSTHIAKKYPSLPEEFLKPILPMLVNGTKEKNSLVKSSSEFALVALLHLRDENDDLVDSITNVLDAGGARDALQDVVSKVLRRVANQPEGIEEVIDDTIQI